MPFIDINTVPQFEVLPGVRIRTPFGQHIMMSYLEMDAGAVVPTHQHPHEQAGMLLTGRMKLTIGDDERIVEAGAMFVIPPNTPHRAEAIGGPLLALDIFSPPREDYAALQNAYIPRSETG